MSHVVLGCRIVLAIVFAVAVWTKLRGPTAFRAFAGSLVQTKLVSWRWRYRVAAMVAGAELATLALLAAVPAAGFGAALVVLAGLTAGVVLTLRRRVEATCRCFGADARRLSTVHVVRNLALAAIAGLGLLAGPAAGITPGGVLITMAAGAVLAVLAMRLDDIVDLARPTVPARQST